MSTKINVAVIVAHPDDETLWAGGTILLHPTWNWFVVCLSRSGDAERSANYSRTLNHLGVVGNMGDLDDGPEQNPLDIKEIELAILKQLPQKKYDLIITHNITGEYTRHLRHEEVGRAVIRLWQQDTISTKELWTFAYEDGGKKYLPKAITKASQFFVLPDNIWEHKYQIITENYGFDKESYEAVVTPKSEAFWQFTDKKDALKWLDKGGVLAD